MNTKRFAPMVLAALVGLAAYTTSTDTGNTVKQTVAIKSQPSVKSDYAIPEGLMNVNQFSNGYTSEETVDFRNKYTALDAVLANDPGSYFTSRFSEFMPTASVQRLGQVKELASNASPEIANVSAKTLLGTLTLEEMMNDPRSRMKAIAVIHNGEVVFENYMGMREWDTHIWASGTKIFPGTLMAIAENEGLVDIKKPVSHYLTELKGTDWDKVAVENALHQRSGMDISESRLGIPNHPVTRLYQIATGDKTLPEGSSLMDAIKDSELHLESGTRFEYASINTHITTLIVERVYNKPIEDLITEKIWGKAGMEGDGALGLSASGEPMAFGAFSSRLRDFGRFGMLFTPSWDKVATEQIIPDNYFSKVSASAGTEFFGEDYMSKRLINDFGANDFGASYQWDAVFTDGDLYKSGRTGQCLYVSPETNTVVVWFSSAFNAEYWAHAYAREIVNQMYR